MKRGVGPRILLIDIENTPFTVYSWDNQPRVPISHKNIVTEQQMISAAWMWEGDPRVYSEMVKVGATDQALTETLQYQISQADAVVAHFGDGHDMPMIRTRCLKWGLGPLKPVVQIDTWKIAKRQFKLFNNKLDYIAQFLGQSQKIETDFDLWKRVMAGDPKARREMLRYNKEDVRVLNRVWQEVRPFAVASLNRALFTLPRLAHNTCPSCGEEALVMKANTFFVTRAKQRPAMQCGQCGHWCTRVNDVPR